jgi:ABC-2 type transport system ATP-binding protein
MSEPAAREPSVVRIESLTVRYGKAVACDRISLAVPAGGVYALLGRNGAGKSSLVRCLLGQQKPQAGRTALFGEDAWKRRARLMERVGVVPEEPDAPPEMTARQLLAFCSRLYRRWDAAASAARLERLEVPLKVPFARLSKGQKGAVMLALSLGHSPDLLVLDDPTLGLDVVARRLLYEELVGDLADRGTTVFLTSHDLAGIEGIADRVGILRDGNLALDEEMERLKLRFRKINYRNEVAVGRREYGSELDAFEAARVRVRGWGIEAVVSNFAEEPFERFRATEGVVDAQVSPMSLEEIFVAVTGEKRGKP